jgi:hypothetical protein
VITLVVLLGILAVVSYLLYEKKKAEREMENSSLSAPGFAVVLEGAQSVSTGRPA